VRSDSRHTSASTVELPSVIGLRCAIEPAASYAAETCASTGESRRCARATAGITTEMATATEVAATAKTTSAAMRTCPRWLSKAYESGAYQAEKFNLFHNTKLAAVCFVAIAHP
jgi:hypothetical protein